LGNTVEVNEYRCLSSPRFPICADGKGTRIEGEIQRYKVIAIVRSDMGTLLKLFDMVAKPTVKIE